MTSEVTRLKPQKSIVVSIPSEDVIYTDLSLRDRDCYVLQDCGICVTVGMSGHPYKRADVMTALIINNSAVQPFSRNVG